MTVKGAFLSDLHLLSRRSVGQQLWERWLAESQDVDVLVLGGDIFDFRWSQLESHADAILQARSWLEHLIELRPEMHIVYLQGNHDCAPAMQTLVDQISELSEKFLWRADHWRAGACVFLHGDVLDAGIETGELDRYRQQFKSEREPRGILANRIYDAAVATRLHALGPRIRHRPTASCDRLTSYLSAGQLGPKQGIEQVYFGHTHLPIHGLQVQDLRFYNPGSGIRHLIFSPQTFTCEAQELTLAWSKASLPANSIEHQRPENPGYGND